MRCEKCQAKEATAYIIGTKTVHLPSGGELSRETFALQVCDTCAVDYRSLFPHLHEEHITERLRIISIAPERTVLRLIRTEDDATPEDWSLLTMRVPAQPVGTEITMTFTPSELEWMKGERELN